MKTTSILLFFYLLLVLSFSFACTSDNYRIDGYIVNALDGDIVYLEVNTGNEFKQIDSARVLNNKFEFRGTQPQPVMALITSYPQTTSSSMPLLFILQDLCYKAKLDTVSTIKSNDENEVLQQFIIKRRPLDYQMEIINRKYIENLLNESISDTLLTQLKVDYKRVENKLKNEIITFIDSHSQSIAAPYLFMRYYHLFTTQEQEKLLLSASSHFTDNYQIEQVIRELEQQKVVAVGNKYIEVILPDRYGNDTLLSHPLRTGEYLLVVFWSTYSGPSRQQIAQLQTFIKQHPELKIRITAISLDTDKTAWINAIKTIPQGWKQLCDFKGWEGEAVRQYGIQSIPYNLLIDNNGTIIAKDFKYKDLTDIMSQK